jgi:LmbE family N-acetylglucosaminyl deacetylase
MELPQEALENSALIVAHPDDEVLWFSSVLEDVKRIIIVFNASATDPDLTRAVSAALAAHPCRDKIVTLDLAQADSHNRADWPHPEDTDYGLRLQRAPGLDAPYAEQAARAAEALDPHLVGIQNVFTHNPWGEYGHEAHVQLSKVTTRLAAKHGAAVWYGNYVSGKSSRLMRQYLSGFSNDYYARDVDAARAREIADNYMRNGAWTFDGDHTWFPTECFIRGPLEAAAEPSVGVLFPVNYIRVPFDPVPATTAPPGIVQRLHRKLRTVSGHAATD